MSDCDAVHQRFRVRVLRPFDREPDGRTEGSAAAGNVRNDTPKLCAPAAISIGIRNFLVEMS